MAPVYRLAVTLDFAAAHQLRCYQGKCERLHGHNFGVEVVVQGSELLPGVEFLMDFGELKKLTQAVLDDLDHRVLGELPAFTERNPSSENIARHIYAELKPRLPGHVRLAEVTVSEKPSSRATYSER